MKIVKRGGAGVGAPTSAWTHLVVWRDPTKSGPVETFVEADDVVGLANEVLAEMPSNAKAAFICERVGAHVGGHVAALVQPDGQISLLLNRPIVDAMTWTYVAGVGMSWPSMKAGVAA